MKKYRFTKRHRTEVLGKVFPWLVLAIMGPLMLAGLTACSPTKVIERVPVYVHDTTATVKEVHDSTFVDRWHTEYQKGDTVFVADSHIYVTYRTITDTAYKYVEKPVEVVKEQIKEVEKPLSWFQKTFIGLGIATLVVLLAWAAWKLWRKFKK